MTPAYVTEVYERIDCHNPLSGHCWTEWGRFLYYEVADGLWPRDKFRSLAKAQAAADAHNQLMKRMEALK